MRAVVTGGCGFIGSHVVDKLIAAGHEVVVLDAARANVNRRAAYLTGDILDPTAVAAAVDKADVVYHLAGMSNVDVAARRPTDTIRVNVEGTAVVADAARAAGSVRVVLASTVWVFGVAAGPQPLDETAPIDLTAPTHLYTSSKVAAEMVLRSYAHLYDLPFTILRYGVPYGPRMRDELVIARFVREARAGEPLTLAGDGAQTRNFVYVEDLADAHVLALQDAAVNQTITLDGPEPVSIRELADAVAAVVGDVDVRHVPGRDGDFNGRAIDTTLARTLLGWKPRTTLLDGLRRYLASLVTSAEASTTVT